MSGPIKMSFRSAVLGSALVVLATPALFAGPLFDVCAAQAASQFEPGFESPIGKDSF